MGLFEKLTKKKEVERIENEESKNGFVSFNQIVKIFKDMETNAFETSNFYWSNERKVEFKAKSKASILVNRSVNGNDNVFSSICSRNRFLKNGKYGFYDELGFVTIPAIYDNASDFIDGLAIVEKDGKLGMIGVNNEIVIPCEFDYPLESKEWSTQTVFNISGLFQRFGEIVAVRNGKGIKIYSKNGEGLLYESEDGWCNSIKNLNYGTFMGSVNVARFLSDAEYLTKILKEKSKLVKNGLISKDDYIYIEGEIFKLVHRSFRYGYDTGYGYLYKAIEQVAKRRPNNPIYKYVVKNKEDLTYYNSDYDPHPACCCY